MSLLLFAQPVLAADRVEVQLDPAHGGPEFTGRLLLAFSPDENTEPRNAIGLNGAALFGIDVEGLAAGEAVVLGPDTAGYPMARLADLPAGDYNVQAILVTYEKRTRSDGHTIWVPWTDRRVGFPAKPGNLHSTASRIHFDPADDATEKLVLDQVIPPLPEPEDTEWVRHVRIRSEILSQFWGADVTIGASVLLPRGFDDHPDARYPVIFPFGHGDIPFGFNTDPASHTERSIASAADANVKTGYEFFQEWNSDDFPRMVAITFEHPSAYFVESYAVNSANNGPWGEAFTQEIIPFLEKEFRLIGAPYARVVEGASTGGWEAMALQLHYPDFFGGAWVFNPDPIDFRHYQLVNIYEDENMFTLPISQWISAERPFRRSREGQPLLSLRQLAQFEAVLGSRGRSGYQLDIWQATHGPVGDDGYPVLLFDKQTGVINQDAVTYYTEQGYDLTRYLRDNWDTLSPRLAGKLHLFAGEMDDFYLNVGVWGLQETVTELGEGKYPIRFEYGRPKKGHNWHHTDWAGVVREVAEQVHSNAPAGADSAQWQY